MFLLATIRYMHRCLNVIRINAIPMRSAAYIKHFISILFKNGVNELDINNLTSLFLAETTRIIGSSMAKCNKVNQYLNNVQTKCYSLGDMLKAITNSKIHQNLLKYWFTLLHFVMDDPVGCRY